MNAPCWRRACVVTRTELPEGQDHGHPTYCTFRTVQRSPRPAAQVSAGRGGWAGVHFPLCSPGWTSRTQMRQRMRQLRKTSPRRQRTLRLVEPIRNGPPGRQHVGLGAASFRAESGRWRQRRSRPLCFGQSTIASSRLQSVSASSAPYTPRSAPSIDTLGLETEQGLSGLVAGRRALTSAVPTLAAKGRRILVHLILRRQRLSGTSPTRVHWARQVFFAILLKRHRACWCSPSRLRSVLLREKPANAQAVRVSVAPQGISQSAVGLVGQTARMDMVAAVATGEVTASAKPAVAGRKAVAFTLSDKGQRLAQVTDLVQRHTAQADTLGRAGHDQGTAGRV